MNIHSVILLLTEISNKWLLFSPTLSSLICYCCSKSRIFADLRQLAERGFSRKRICVNLRGICVNLRISLFTMKLLENEDQAFIDYSFASP